jgi:hypothetical protein
MEGQVKGSGVVCEAMKFNLFGASLMTFFKKKNVWPMVNVKHQLETSFFRNPWSLYQNYGILVIP